ncbi:MAG: alanine racemase, partial [Clostridia bacterium]|nr:alanine racemase [Clostridia bacterium]
MTEKSYKERLEILEENLPRIRREVEEYGKGKATLLAATKTVPVDVIDYAIDHMGLTCIGENRVQELLEKYDALHKDGIEIHFIGRLQTNKVKYIIDKVSLIHSVDSEKLAREINRQAEKHGIVMDILVEVNVGREESKGGIYPEELATFL